MSWAEPRTWEWATLTRTAVGAGFGTALVQGLLAIYRDTRQRKSQAAYMAMRLAVILEEYASARGGGGAGVTAGQGPAVAGTRLS